MKCWAHFERRVDGEDFIKNESRHPPPPPPRVSFGQRFGIRGGGGRLCCFLFIRIKVLSKIEWGFTKMYKHDSTVCLFIIAEMLSWLVFLKVYSFLFILSYKIFLLVHHIAGMKFTLLRSYFCFFSTGVGWKVHRLTMMPWSNLTRCGLIFSIFSTAVHTLLASVLQRLNSRGIEALILILEKIPQLQIMTSSSVWYCNASHASVFFISWNRN